jgi:hypothetical protein
MKRTIFAIGLAASMLLAGCASSDEGNVTAEPETAAPNEVQDIKKLVNDYSVGNIEDQKAAINSHQLIVTDSDESQVTYDLPEDEFFVSIAPYIDSTHPWQTHSLTGCQGELVEEEFDVLIEDEEGNVILEEKVTSQANGFIDLWLPRDMTYQVTINQDGKVAEQELSTFEGDDTCVTTMQLM